MTALVRAYSADPAVGVDMVSLLEATASSRGAIVRAKRILKGRLRLVGWMVIGPERRSYRLMRVPS
jgi:hypothetical protein